MPCKKFAQGSEERFLSEVRRRHIYIAIKEYHAEQRFPVEATCEQLHVVRSDYHKWGSGRQIHRSAENEQQVDKIEKINSESPDKIYRRLNDDLRHDHSIYVKDK